MHHQLREYQEGASYLFPLKVYFVSFEGRIQIPGLDIYESKQETLKTSVNTGSTYYMELISGWLLTETGFHEFAEFLHAFAGSG